MSTLVFAVTYIGVAIGRIPGLALDRTGIALLGAIAMVVTGALPAGEALGAIHAPTLLLLYGLMVVSAQLRLGGFYTWLARRITRHIEPPERFLLLVMASSAALASVLANDIICLAFTPVLAATTLRRGYNPVPFLLGLAMATNLGSASTIIGNPQSMLIGQLGNLSFLHFTLWCLPPSLVGLAATYGIILLMYRNRFRTVPGPCLETADESAWPAFNVWQSAKGLAAAAIVVVLLLSPLPREWSVMAVAGCLLLSRRMHTRAVLGLIDWHLITLFCGLFIVVRGFNASGVPDRLLADLAERGLVITNPYTLSVMAMLLSNIVSNVPATMLFSPYLPADIPETWYVLSLATTYAGNLLTIGSIANLIVIEQARQQGVRISLGEYARTGIPVSACNLAILCLWIYVR